MTAEQKYIPTEGSRVFTNEATSKGQLIIRTFDPQQDSVSALTSLVQAAYRAKHEGTSVNFMALNQTDAQTRERMEYGVTLLAELNGQLVGTNTYYPPKEMTGAPAEGHPDATFFDEPGIAQMGQLAALPEVRDLQIGARMMRIIRQLAIDDGAKELAGTTAKPAEGLVKFYQRAGARIVREIQYSEDTFPSVILSTELPQESSSSRRSIK